MKKIIVFISLFLISCAVFSEGRTYYYQKGYDTVWNSLEEYFVQSEGFLKEYDKSKGIYVVSFENFYVKNITVLVEKLTLTTTRIRVKTSSFLGFIDNDALDKFSSEIDQVLRK